MQWAVPYLLYQYVWENLLEYKGLHQNKNLLLIYSLELPQNAIDFWAIPMNIQNVIFFSDKLYCPQKVGDIKT